jgi:hypothetical protein
LFCTAAADALERGRVETFHGCRRSVDVAAAKKTRDLDEARGVRGTAARRLRNAGA